MDRIAFRRLLPILFLLVSGALMLVVRAEQRIKDEQFKAREAEFKWEQVTGKVPEGTVAWDPLVIAGRLPQASGSRVALILVATPGSIGALIGALLDWPFRGDLFVWIGWSVGVATFWYAMGVHLDNKKNDSFLRLPTWVRYYLNTLRVLSPLALTILLMGYLFDRHDSFSGNNALFASALIAWCIWGTWSLRRRSTNRSPSVIPTAQSLP